MPSIQAILQEHHIPYRMAGEHHHVTKNRIGIDCPFCSPNSNKYRLGIHLFRNSVSCWVCGKLDSYQVYNVLGLSYAVQQSIREAQRQSNTYLAAPGVKPRGTGTLKLPDGLGPLLGAHKAYLGDRGFDWKTVLEEWGVQGIGIAPRLSWRLFIPITQSNRVVSWTTRALSNNTELRYITAKPEEETVSCKSVLFGSDRAKHSILICEGPLDSIKVGYGAVATLGVDYSRKQLREMAKFPRRYVCFDNEPQAQTRANELVDDLCDLPGETWNIVLDCKDPGEAGEKELNQLRELLT